MITVLDSASVGMLYDYLLDEDKRRGLTWEKRLNICIDVANALNYLHSQMEDGKMMINNYINSRNISLDENMRAKIVDFSRSVALPPDHENEDPSYDISDDTRHYVDPQYKKTGKLRRESDVYSFGVVMFEILRGSIASNFKYWNEYDEGLAYSARGCFEEGSAEAMIDPLINEETGEHIFILNKGANMNSLHTFIEIAYKCVSESQDDRPTMESIVQELNQARYLHLDKKNNPVISLERIKKATENFKNCIGKGGFGEVYTGELQDGDTVKTIVAKKWNNEKKQDEGQFKKLFLRELQISVEYKHENVVALVGYCDDNDEKVLVYEYASNGSLDKHLDKPSLTWLKRLDICIGVASALTFFHGGSGKQAKVVHRDIKTANILLTHDWEAKLADFGLSLISAITKETDYVIDGVCGTPGYIDPLYEKSKFLTIESDIYSFGVVLFEILCGMSTRMIHKKKGLYLSDFDESKFNEKKREEVVFEPLQKQIVQESLIAFQDIACKCLRHKREDRPKANEVLVQLQKAKELQISGGDGATTATSISYEVRD